MPLRRVALAAAVVAVLGIPAAFAAGRKPAPEVMPRVQYHLGEIDTLTQHFEDVIGSPCPHFASSADWDSYFDGEVDRVGLLVAHVNQAWRGGPPAWHARGSAAARAPA